MKRFILIASVLTLAGCSWFREPPPPVQTITPGSRVIYNGGVAVWAVCDRGNLLYFSQGTPAVSVIAGGCPTGTP